jgi:hypothetical protein
MSLSIENVGTSVALGFPSGASQIITLEVELQAYIIQHLPLRNDLSIDQVERLRSEFQ